MKGVNLFITLLSLNAVLIILERLSPTTQIILQPYSFLRVHEVLQMSVIILLGIIISFYLFRELTDNFSLLKTNRGFFWGMIYIIGTYFYATGNGLHEVASFLFNTFCNVHHFTSTVCGSMFFNDYYVGNIVYFVGLLLSNVSFIMFERMRVKKGEKNNSWIVIANGIVYAFAFVAYAAFDPVLVGLYFTIIAAISINYLLFSAKTKITNLPFTLYCSIGYSLGAIVSFFLRFH